MEQCPSCSKFWLFKSFGGEFCESCGYIKRSPDAHLAVSPKLGLDGLIQAMLAGTYWEPDELQLQPE